MCIRDSTGAPRSELNSSAIPARASANQSSGAPDIRVRELRTPGSGKFAPRLRMCPTKRGR
eukprot:9946646-Alexandrium_andersonii.AAC.1